MASQLLTTSTRLIAHNTGGRAVPEIADAAALQVCERLRPQLATLMGNGGARALLLRALALARVEDPSLRLVSVTPQGSFAVANDPTAAPHPEPLTQGGARVLAQLLRLLVAHIGPNLTTSLVREVWPEFEFGNSELGAGE